MTANGRAVGVAAPVRAPAVRPLGRPRTRGRPRGHRRGGHRAGPGDAAARARPEPAASAAADSATRARPVPTPPPAPPLRPPQGRRLDPGSSAAAPSPAVRPCVIGETRAACTALLRGVAADLAGDSKGPDPVALLIDPTPEELADWKREAPQAEIVSAGQARHATDALALAKTRAASEDVILLVDSLTRLAEEFGDTDTAKDFFDAGQERHRHRLAHGCCRARALCGAP